MLFRLVYDGFIINGARANDFIKDEFQDIKAVGIRGKLLLAWEKIYFKFIFTTQKDCAHGPNLCKEY